MGRDRRPQTRPGTICRWVRAGHRRRGMQRTRPGGKRKLRRLPFAAHVQLRPLPTSPTCSAILLYLPCSSRWLSSTSFPVILVSTSKVQQIAQTGQRREEGMKGSRDAGLRLRHAGRRPTPLLRAVLRLTGTEEHGPAAGLARATPYPVPFTSCLRTPTRQTRPPKPVPFLIRESEEGLLHTTAFRLSGWGRDAVSAMYSYVEGGGDGLPLGHALVVRARH
jgi:hypothetical protein